MVDIASGKLLIADPFLRDPHFRRSVVFVCEHKEEGSFGFVLNKQHDQLLGDILQGFETSTIPVYYGGPVQLDTLHYLHQCPELIPGGIEVINGIYWGGEFEAVLNLLTEQKLNPANIRFFVGYSGWGAGQLEEEMKTRTWITTDATRQIIFPTNIADTWNQVLRQLGGEYAQMVNYPIDPQLN